MRWQRMGQTASCLAAKEQHNRQSADSLSLRERKQRDREKCVSLVLWKKPLVTLHYFLLELLITLKDWKWRLWRQRHSVFSAGAGHPLLYRLLC